MNPHVLDVRRCPFHVRYRTVLLSTFLQVCFVLSVCERSVEGVAEASQGAKQKQPQEKSYPHQLQAITTADGDSLMLPADHTEARQLMQKKKMMKQGIDVVDSLSEAETTIATLAPQKVPAVNNNCSFYNRNWSFAVIPPGPALDVDVQNSPCSQLPTQVSDAQPLFIQSLKKHFSDVRVLRRPPTPNEAASWKQKIVVVEEGFWRQVQNATHFYNIASMEIPYLALNVINPLKRANRSAKLILAKEHPHSNCTLPSAALQAQLQLTPNSDTLTTANLKRQCRSGIEMLPAVFPQTEMEFNDGVPQCEAHARCTMPAAIDSDLSRDATLLFMPMIFPIGISFRQFCSERDAVAAARSWVHGLTEAPGTIDQILLIKRGTDLKTTSDNYHYERPSGTIIPNWDEVEHALVPWAADRGFAIKSVVLEELPFAEQVREVRKSKVLVGYEGAGLAFMMYLEDPRKSAVVELNSADGNVQWNGEFPALAQKLGVRLWQHVFRCAREEALKLDPDRLKQTLADVLRNVTS